MDALQIISQSSMKTEKPAIQIGDYVRIAVKIREGDKERNGYSRFIPPTL